MCTHTLLAQCLQDAAARGDAGANLERKERQMLVFQRFLHSMATRGFEAEGDALYDVYCEASREHLLTYIKEGARAPQASLGWVCV